MSMLVSHSMRFCTDNFGFNLNETVPSGDVTLTGGSGTWTVTGDGSTSIINPNSTSTVPIGDDDHVSVTTGASTRITVTGSSSPVTVTGDSGEIPMNAVNGTPVTVSGGGNNIIIFSCNIVREYGGGGDSTNEMIDSGGNSNENSQRVAFAKSAVMRGFKVWDCTDASDVNGFNITAANVDGNGVICRFIFARSSKFKESDPSSYYTLVPNADNPFVAELKPFNYDLGTDTARFKNISAYGNTIAEVRNFTSIPGFIGARISPWYVLQAPSDAAAVPYIRLDLKKRVSSDITTKIFETDIYLLSSGGTAPIISEIIPKITTVEGGSVNVFVKLFGENDTGGSDWMNVDAAKDKSAYSIQFKFEYAVQSVNGNDMARVDSIVVKHSYGESIVSGTSANVYTVVTNYEVPLQMCYVVVRHNKLVGSTINAYVNFMHKPKHRELLYVGQISNDAEGRAELVLGESGVADKNIDASTIKIFAGNSSEAGADYEITDFSFANSTSTISITGELNSRMIYASYDYNIDTEVWRKMELDVTEPYTNDATYASRFTYVLPDDEARPSDSDLAKVISNVRIKMTRNKGTTTRENLNAKTTKKRQLFVLSHVPDVSTIKFTNADGSVEYGSESISSWKFNDETNILSVVGAKTNLPLYVSYDWVGESVTIYSIACGWSVA